MFAYVNFVSGKYLNKKKIFPTSEIINFKPDVHQKNIKYKVLFNNETHQVTVLLLANSESEIDKIIQSNKRRLTSAPSRLLLSAASDNDDAKCNNKIEKSRSLRKSELEAALAVKLDTSKNLTKCSASKSVDVAETFSGSENDKENGIMDTDSVSANTESEDNEFEPSAKRLKVESVPVKSDKKVLCESLNNGSNKTNAPRVTVKKIETIGDPIIKITNPKISDPASSQSDYDKLLKQYNELKTKCNDLKKKVKELENVVEKLKASKSNLKVAMKKVEDELKKVRETNDNLQTKIIERVQERDALIDKLLKSNDKVTYEDNYPPIGTVRTSDNLSRVHIGRNQWISESEYSCIINSSKTPRQCAGNILTVVFNEDVLLRSTISGHKSNKSGRDQCEKLDEIKIGACEDFYIYWMKNKYIPTKEQEKVYLTDLNKFEYYASKKIAELKRPPRKAKRIKKNKSDQGAEEKEKESEEDRDGKEESEDKNQIKKNRTKKSGKSQKNKEEGSTSIDEEEGKQTTDEKHRNKIQEQITSTKSKKGVNLSNQKKSKQNQKNKEDELEDTSVEEDGEGKSYKTNKTEDEENITNNKSEKIENNKETNCGINTGNDANEIDDFYDWSPYSSDTEHNQSMKKISTDDE